MNRPDFQLPRGALSYASDPLASIPWRERRVQYALALSVLAHALVLLLAFRTFDPTPFVSPELEVVLVNSKATERPSDPTRRAQTNLNGGGNTDEDRVMKTPLAAVNDELAHQASETEARVARLEGDARALMAKIRAAQQLEQQAQGAPQLPRAGDAPVTPPAPNPQNEPSEATRGIDPNATGTAFARQLAEISRNYDAYQKRPRRKEIGGRAVAYIFAQYEDDYRARVERVGTVNYPAPHDGRPVYGKVRLTVSVKPDGSIEKIVLNMSSGDSYLDRQAEQIVRMSAPFGRFTPEMLREADVLDITRTFTFTRLADGVHSEAE